MNTTSTIMTMNSDENSRMKSNNKKESDDSKSSENDLNNNKKENVKIEMTKEDSEPVPRYDSKRSLYGQRQRRRQVHRGPCPSKRTTYEFLHSNRGWKSALYHIFVVLLILLSSVLALLASIDLGHNKIIVWCLVISDGFLLAIFVTEFFLRLWSSDSIRRFRGWKGKFVYYCDFGRAMDLLFIVTLSITLIWLFANQMKFAGLLAFPHLFQLVQLWRDRGSHPLRLLFGALRDSFLQITLVYCIGFLTIVFFSMLGYLAEKNANVDLDNIPKALYWGFITLTTIGYGDVVPQTWVCKMLICFFVLVGVSLVTLPPSIIGTAVALKIQEKHDVFGREARKDKKKREVSAKLIQTLWRKYATGLKSSSRATWKKFSGKGKKHIKKKNKEKTAIRALLKMQFLAALTRFRQFKEYENFDITEIALGNIKLQQITQQTFIRITWIHKQFLAQMTKVLEIINDRFDKEGKRTKETKNDRLDKIEKKLQNIEDKLTIIINSLPAARTRSPDRPRTSR